MLEAVGLKVIQKGKAELPMLAQFVVAKDEKTLDEMMSLDPAGDHRRYGELMGYSDSMIDAFERKTERLPEKDRPKESAAQVFQVRLSRDHLEEEMDVLRKWEQGVKKYAPESYRSLLGEE